MLLNYDEIPKNKLAEGLRATFMLKARHKTGWLGRGISAPATRITERDMLVPANDVDTGIQSGYITSPERATKLLKPAVSRLTNMRGSTGGTDCALLCRRSMNL